MASTITFGKIETRIRRDLLNDNDNEAYRWSVSAIMSRMNESVVEIVGVFNSWAGYNQETGIRIYDVHTEDIESNCDTTDPSQNLAMNENTEVINRLRSIVIPIDDRYADAIAYLAAAKLLETDNSDTMNLQKAAQYMTMGKEYAIR